MMKKLILILTLFISSVSIAGNGRGGSIHYEYLGDQQYKITARLYTHCSGNLYRPRIYLHDGVFRRSSDSIAFSKTSSHLMTRVCSDSSNPDCSQMPGNMGIRENIYVGYVDFKENRFKRFADSVCELYFAMEYDYRAGDIIMQGGSVMYVESMLNLCLSDFKNSSPAFLLDPLFSVECGSPLFYNVLANDPDRDSVVFNLISAVTPDRLPVSHYSYVANAIPLNPYCPPNPSTINCKALPQAQPPRGFYFDAMTGDMILTPTKCDQAVHLVVECLEFRRVNGKMEKIGSTIRENLLVVNGSGILGGNNNSLPAVTFPNNKRSLKAGQSLCLDISVSDSLVSGQNRGDSTTIEALGLPPGATFSVLNSSSLNPGGRICWTPHDSLFTNELREFNCVVLIKDNFCPFPKTVQRGFYFVLLPKDSLASVNIKVFMDENSNGTKDNNEEFLSTGIYIKHAAYNRKVSVVDGTLSMKVRPDSFRFILPEESFFQGMDTSLYLIEDSLYEISFPVKRKPGVYGKIYKDLNRNCVFDKGESLISNAKIKSSKGQLSFSNRNGDYYLALDSGQQKISLLYHDKRLAYGCRKDSSIVYTLDSVLKGFDFPLIDNDSFTDLAVSVNWQILRRGFLCQASLSVTNRGNQKQYNVRAAMPERSDLAFRKQDGSDAGIDTLKLFCDSLLPGQSFNKKVWFIPDTADFKVGDKICFNAFFEPLSNSGDSVPENDTYQACPQIVGPLDPNLKELTNGREIYHHNRFIDYVIHFQNKGTDTAFRVEVIDSIDLKYLDPSEFQLNWSDYPCEVLLNGNVLRFVFDEIRLPYESLSGDASQASFGFSLGLKPQSNNEQKFYNRAGIYFDFERPVITPDAEAKYSSPFRLSGMNGLKLCNNDSLKLRIESLIALENNNEFQIEVLQNAQILNNYKVSSDQALTSFTIPLKGFNQGQYQLRLRSSAPGMKTTEEAELKFEVLKSPEPLVYHNLKNNQLCSNLDFTLSVSDGKSILELFINSEPELKNNSSIYYVGKLSEGDVFKVICRDTISACSETVSIYPEILDAPLTGLQISKPAKAFYCEGDSIHLSASGANTYQFFLDAVLLSGNSFVLEKNCNVRALGFNSNQCSDSSDVLNIQAYPLPEPFLNLTDPEICSGEMALLEADTTGTANLYKNNVLLLADVNQSSIALPNVGNGDRFILRSSNQWGCQGESNEVIQAVRPLPDKPVIQASGNKLFVNSVYQIKWYRNDTLIGAGDSLYPSISGTYRAEATNQYDCRSNSEPYLHYHTSISNVFNNDFILYPNPAKDYCLISWSAPYATALLRITDMNGRVLQETELENGSRLALDNLSSGIYLISLKAGDGLWHEALRVE